MNCKGCWNFSQCEKKSNPKLVYCFKKHESLCHYCGYENICEDASNTKGLCNEFIRKENYMVNNFKCRANENGYCKQWLRGCVGWENCNLKSYGAPCAGCIDSSPLYRERCKLCDHRKWKEDNYVE